VWQKLSIHKNDNQGNAAVIQ